MRQETSEREHHANLQPCCDPAYLLYCLCSGLRSTTIHSSIPACFLTTFVGLGNWAIGPVVWNGILKPSCHTEPLPSQAFQA